MCVCFPYRVSRIKYQLSTSSNIRVLQGPSLLAHGAGNQLSFVCVACILFVPSGYGFNTIEGGLANLAVAREVRLKEIGYSGAARTFQMPENKFLWLQPLPVPFHLQYKGA